MTVQASPFALHPDRLFPPDPAVGDIARTLYGSVKDLPIVSPHGHTDARWFAENTAFPDPARLFIVPDHYVHRMLYSQGVRPEEVGVPRIDGGPVETDPRKIWQILAANFKLFRGTPSWLWLNHAFTEVFGVTERLTAESGDRIYDHIARCLERPEFRPRALFDRFHIEALTTTESPLDDLAMASKHQGERLGRKGHDRLPSRSGCRPRLSGLPRQSRGARADHGTRPLDLRKLPRRARRAPRVLQVGRLHVYGSWPPDRADRRPRRR